jgi:hypothetical protein
MTLFALPAGAATQLGQTFDAPFGCVANSTLIQSGSPGGQYAAPFAGVITSWSFQGAGSPPQVRLKVARPGGGNVFTIVGDSSLHTPSQGLNTYPDVRISVQPGDVIGLYRTTAGDGCVGSGAGYQTHVLFSDPPPGTTATFNGPSPNNPMNLSAILEPDADNDGFGDETQDCAPDDPSRAGDCAPPETTITKGPKNRTKQKVATFDFSSSETGSTFECELDDNIGFAPCSSSLTVKVGRGKHSLEVRATDSAGNVDGSPASDDWRVKKKQKKK